MGVVQEDKRVGHAGYFELTNTCRAWSLDSGFQFKRICNSAADKSLVGWEFAVKIGGWKLPAILVLRSACGQHPHQLE